MYFIPPRNEARAAFAGEPVALPDIAKRAGAAGDNNNNGNTVDPFESLISAIFGGGDETTTTTTKKGSTKTSSTSTPLVVIPTSRTSTTTSTTSTTSSHSAAQVVTTPPPQVTTTPHSTTTITSTLPVNTANTAAQSTSSNNSGLPSVVVGVIVAAAVIFGLILISLITRKIFQARRKNRRNTWARSSINPFSVPPVTEKALPPPPPAEATQPEYASYPSYPPPAMTYANATPYSPAAASSAGYPAPYPYETGNGNTPMLQQGNNAMFNSSAYTPADLAGPVVIQQTPPTPLTAATPAGQISVVKRTFVPSLPDELSIANGDQVRVISAYDDGWALCEKISTGEKGVVPQECLEEMKSTTSSNTPGQQLAANENAARLNRASSLHRGQEKTY